MLKKKSRYRWVAILVLAPAVGMFGLSIMSKRPANLGVTEGKLAPCPNSPNCVSSQTEDGAHFLKPIAFEGDATTAIENLKKVLANRPRTVLVTETGNYLHFEATSLMFRFVDDLEFLIDEDAGLIHFRSASRVGKSDLGVNRKRMEEIRRALKEVVN